MKSNILYIYNRLQHLQKNIKQLLYEVEKVSIKEPIIKKSKDLDEEKLLSVVVNYTKLQKESIPNETDVIITNLDEMLTEANANSKEIRLKVKDIQVNITKMLNELKEFGTEDEVKELSETREAIRKISVIYNNIKKLYLEANEKMVKFQEKYNLKQKFDAEVDAKLESMRRKIEKELMKKYNLTSEDLVQLEQFDYEKSTNKAQIDENLKDLVRKVKDYIHKLTNIDKILVDNVKLYVKAFEFTAMVSKAQQGYYMLNQEAFDIIKNDPYILEKLGSMIKYIEPKYKVGVSDKPLSISPYYSEHKVEIQNSLKSLEDVQKEMNEGIGQMIKGVLVAIKRKVKSVYTKVASSIKKISTEFTSENKDVFTELENMEKQAIQDSNKLKTELSQFIIKYKKADAKAIENKLKL